MPKKITLLFLQSWITLSLSVERPFPDGFMFGTATASYQIEGGWNEDDKSESIWDYALHKNPCVILDCTNGDIADDSYHQYERDVEILRELGVDYYRFSLSWTRILPTGFPDKISEQGVRYYNNLINEMMRYNITPMITIYHWDLPQNFQDMGGWANPSVIDWFGDYARVVFELFGDRVKYWMTVNEPYQICTRGYGTALQVPLVNISGIADYMCTKNLLLAHARAYYIYDQEFRARDGGLIFIAFDCQWYEPDSVDDAIAAEEASQFMWQQFTHPVFSETGGFPPAMRARIDAKSAEQGYPRSRLPDFTPEERDYVKGSSDLFGINHYLTYMTYRNETVNGYYEVPSFYDDAGVITYTSLNMTLGETNYISYNPPGFYKLLTKIKEAYNNPPIVITENGFATFNGLTDENRVRYVKGFLNSMLDAIEDGSNIIAYTLWSMIDNFEWMAGYTVRFGLYEVDYESPNRTRTPRKSAFVYKQILRTRSLDVDYEPPADAVMSIDVGH